MNDVPAYLDDTPNKHGRKCGCDDCQLKRDEQENSVYDERGDR